jgi:ribosome-associated protein
LRLIKIKTHQALVAKIVKAAEVKKANNIKVLDLSQRPYFTDYLVICSGESGPQLRALEKEIDKTLKNNRIKGFRWEGTAASGWLILDLGGIVVHVMGEAERDYYNLEDLWGSEAVVFHY